MFHLSTIRRRLMLAAGSLLVLSGLSLMVVHTSLVRRFVLVQVQIRLGNAMGVVLDARDLDYNLFSSRFVLRDIALKGVGLAEMPAPLRAQRLQLVIPLWRLIRGSFDTARIRIDGLSVHWYASPGGQNNWPAIRGFGGAGNPGGPALLVAGGEIYLQDDRNGLHLHLPLNQLSGGWDPAMRRYAVVCNSSGGWLRWKDSRLPLETLQLKSAFAGGAFSIESLRLVSGESEMAGSGSLSGAPAGIRAAADLRLDLRGLSRALAPGTPARGRLQVHLSATGPLKAVRIKGALRGEDVVVGGIPIRHPAAEALLDTLTGEVRIQDLSAGLWGGQLTGNGRVRLGSQPGRSEFTASLNGLDPQQVAAWFGHADVPRGPAALEVAASWPGMDWRLAAVSGVARLRSARVAFTATGGPGSLRASLDSTLGDTAAAHGEIGITFAGRTLAGLVRGQIDNLVRFGSQLEDLLDRPAGALNLPAIDGSARWSATLGGTAALPSASLRLEAGGLSLGTWTGASLQLEASYAANRIAIERAQLASPGQRIQAHGEIDGTSADAPLRLDGTIEIPSLAAVLGNLALAPSVEASVSGGFRLSGTIARPVAETTLHSGPLSVYGQSFSRASLDARWKDGELALTRFTADQDHQSGAPGRFEAGGSLNLATGRYVVEAGGRNLRPTALRLPGGQPLTGTFQFAAQGEGALSDPVFRARLDSSDVRVGKTPVGELHAKVDAAGRRAAALLALPGLNTNVTSTITMQGAWPFELALDSRNARLETAPASAFDAAARAGGTLAPLRLERATAAIDNFHLALPKQEILGDGPIELSYADGRVRVGRLALKSGATVLRLSGQMPLQDDGPAGSLALQGTVHLGLLSLWLPAAASSRIEGVAEVNAGVTGSLRNWQPSGTVTIRDGLFHWQPIPFAFENISGGLKLQDGVIRLDQIGGKAGTGTFQIGGSLPLRLISGALPAPSVDAGQPARFSARLDKLQLSRGSGEQVVTTTVGARLEGEASDLSLQSLRATIDLNELQISSRTRRLEQEGPARIAIADSVARLEHFAIGRPGASMKAAGTLGLTGSFPLQLEAAGKGDLAFLSALAAPVEAAGDLQLDLRVGGTLSAPQASGFVELERASVSLPNPRLQAAGVRLRADLAGDHVTVKELSGTLNGGAFVGGGDLKLGAQGPRDVNLFLKGKDTFVEYPASVKTTSTLDVKLVSRENRLVLAGQIDVQEGYYESSLDLFSSTDQGLYTGPEGPPDPRANPVALDLRILTRRPVEMDNNLGRLAATADLRLTGTIRKPGLLGRLELEQDGRFYFGDRTYYIERGTVRFLDETRVTPELNIQAYTRTGDYTIKLGLTGQLNELTTTFTSDPPLSRDDVIAVLLTGKTLAENRGVDLRALEATSLATGAMNASLSSQLHRAVGVSRVSIQPGAIAAESNPGARITITQDFTSALRLIYSMNLSDSNDQIWIGEYDLSGRFTTRAVKQSDNTYRGEFRHDIRFGSSSPSAASVAVRPASRKISQVNFTGVGPFPPHDLAKVFNVKPGQQYKAIKVRKGTERLTRFLMKKGYLESRVRLDRNDDGRTMGLTVRIELGPVVELTYQGANLPRRQKSRLRNVWHAGISDQQRPQASKDAILGHFARKGYLRAEADVHIAGDPGRKVVRFDLRPGPRYHGVKIAVEAAEPTRAREILSLVQEKPMKLALYRNPARVVEAVTRYYQQRGFLAAKVSPPVQKLDAQRRTGRIVIPVEEGPRFHVGALQFAGNRAISAKDLETGLPLAAGAVFEPARLVPAVVALKAKYGRLGYSEADIEYSVARHDDRASVDVSFTVLENKQTSIATVAVEGNRHTSDQFARSRLRVAEGEVANTELIRESVKNLSQSGAYTSADIQMQPPPESGASDKPIRVADLRVAVAEPKPFRLLYGGLYDSGNGPGFIADLQNLNSLGAGRVLGLRARFDSETNEARIYLTQPTWGLRRLSTTFSTYYTHQTEYLQTTPTEKLGVSLQQDLQLSSKWMLSYGYRYEKQRGFVPDPAAPDIPVSVVAVAPLTLTLSRDSRDSFLDATRGSFVSHGFEFAPRFLGSDYPYTRYYVQYFRYFPLTHPRPVPYGEKEQRSRLVFATGTRLGVQKGFNSEGAVLTDRFYAGGGTTVRGFRQDELGPKLANGQPAGGNAVLVLNEEIRYPLFWIFDAVTFVDIGNVFPRVSDFRLSELRAAGGFGLRLRNPFVVLRFDYGFKFDRRPGETVGAFFFSIGQAF